MSSAAKCLRSSPLWFLAPAVAIGIGAAAAVNSYEPLVFDPAQYQAEAAQASELGKSIDAEALEKKNKAAKSKFSTSAALPADTGSKASKLAKATLADGQFAGYSRCREDDIFDYYLKLTVVVKNGKVSNIKDICGSSSGNSGDRQLGPYDSINDTYIAMARAEVPVQIIKVAKEGKVPSDIDAVSGATYSSNSILEAYLDALSKSAAKAGNSSNIKKPSKPNKKNPAKDDSSKDEANGSGGASDDSGSSDDTVDDYPILDYGTGRFTAYALCRNEKLPSAYSPYYIGVTIDTLDGKVSAVVDIFGDDKGVVEPGVVYDAAENRYYLDRALKGYGVSGRHPGVKTQIETLVSQGKADGKFDTISGATYSSKSIIEAYRAALGLAHASVAASGGLEVEGDSTTEGDVPDSSTDEITFSSEHI